MRYQWDQPDFALDGYLSAYYYQEKFDAQSIFEVFEFSIDGIWRLLTYHLPEVVAIAALPAFALLLAAAFLGKFQEKFQDGALVVLFLFCLAVSAGAAVLGIYPLGSFRSGIYLGPIVFLAVGVAFQRTAGCLASLTRRGWLAPALAVAVAGAIAFTGVSAMRQDSPYQTPENIKSVLAVLQERVREEDMVYAGWGAVPAMQFYQGNEERPANYYYGTSSWCTRPKPCLREMADLAYRLGTVNGRIWFVTYAHPTEFVEEAEIAGPDVARILGANGAKRVGDIITVYLVDDKSHRADDTPVNPWRWQRADPAPGAGNTPDDATWTHIEGARSYNYTPASEDEGKFLRAWVSYEKNGITYRVQTEAIGPIEGMELLGEQVLFERVFTDVPGLSVEQVVFGGRANLLPYLYLIEDTEPLINRYATDVLKDIKASLTRKPSIRSTFDVYLSEDMLIYVKEPCAPADTEATFFLHLIPTNVADLPDYRQQHGFDNLDFDFEKRGVIFDGKCLAKVSLPAYGISGIRTGQYMRVDGGFKHLWKGEFRR